MKKKLKKAQNGTEAAPTDKPIYKQESFFKGPLQLNWSHILASQVVQGLSSAASNNSPNSFENATLRYNQSIPPTSWLPQNPNTSVQALYGMADGGIIDEYIRNFIYGDAIDDTKPMQEEGKKKKKSPTTNMVSEDDIEMDFPEQDETPFYKRMPSSFRINQMLGADDSDVTTLSNVNNVSLDPNVVAATQELLTKFPNLKVTSGIRNWGDKDAHPKGRAVDLAGPDLNAAYDYYKNSIVPKYGFNSALPVNHGTGPHIHLGYYQQGGQKPPIYTDNPNDPRLRAYRDSLKLYNFTGDLDLNKFRPGWKAVQMNDMQKKTYQTLVRDAIDTNGSVTVNGVTTPKGDYYGTPYHPRIAPTKSIRSGDWNDDGSFSSFDAFYKKPVQPIIYQQKPKHPYTKSVAEDSTLPTVANNLRGNPQMPELGVLQGKSNYAFQYRDENGNQQVIYFPNSAKMAEFAKDQPWSSKSGGKDWWTINAQYLKKQEGGYHYGVIEEEMKKGGHWIQGAVNPKHKGYCTPMTKSTCTGRRRAFALTMKKHHGFHKKQDGGLINETGYTEGSPTEDNPVNVIPSGSITMANVYSPVVAVPHKNGKPGKPVVMQPQTDYTFDADYTLEFKAGGTYDLSPAHIEYLRKLGYEVEEIS